jgi:hypothetical protein
MFIALLVAHVKSCSKGRMLFHPAVLGFLSINHHFVNIPLCPLEKLNFYHELTAVEPFLTPSTGRIVAMSIQHEKLPPRPHSPSGYIVACIHRLHNDEPLDTFTFSPFPKEFGMSGKKVRPRGNICGEIKKKPFFGSAPGRSRVEDGTSDFLILLASTS